MTVQWKAEAATALSKTAIQTAIKKFKGVTAGHITDFKDGHVAPTLSFKGADGVVVSAMFHVRSEGAKVTLNNLEIMAEVPRVKSSPWRKVKLTDATGTLNQVLTSIVKLMQERATKGVRRSNTGSGGAPAPSNAPKGKLIDSKKWYVVDMTGKEFISSGPYASEKIALKQAKPDGPKGVVYEDVMTGADCKDNSIKWG